MMEAFKRARPMRPRAKIFQCVFERDNNALYLQTLLLSQLICYFAI